MIRLVESPLSQGAAAKRRGSGGTVKGGPRSAQQTVGSEARMRYATPAPLACTSAWYEERTIGPEATWLKPSS